MAAPLPDYVEKAIYKLEAVARNLGYDRAMHEEDPVNAPAPPETAQDKAGDDLRAAIHRALDEARKKEREGCLSNIRTWSFYADAAHYNLATIESIIRARGQPRDGRGGKT